MGVSVFDLRIGGYFEADTDFRLREGEKNVQYGKTHFRSYPAMSIKLEIAISIVKQISFFPLFCPRRFYSRVLISRLRVRKRKIWKGPNKKCR